MRIHIPFKLAEKTMCACGDPNCYRAVEPVLNGFFLHTDVSYPQGNEIIYFEFAEEVAITKETEKLADPITVLLRKLQIIFPTKDGKHHHITYSGDNLQLGVWVEGGGLFFFNLKETEMDGMYETIIDTIRGALESVK